MEFEEYPIVYKRRTKLKKEISTEEPYDNMEVKQSDNVEEEQCKERYISLLFFQLI